MIDPLERRDAIERYGEELARREKALEAAKSIAAAWSYGTSDSDFNVYFTGEGSDLARRIMTFADNQVHQAKSKLRDLFPVE